MTYYFAYGSNLDKNQMKERGMKVIGKPVPTKLFRYRLVFSHYSPKWVGGAADILRNEDDYVFGQLYEVEDITQMDKHEGCKWGDEAGSRYYRREMTVTTDEGDVQAWVYYFVKPEKYSRPAERYVTSMMSGMDQYQRDRLRTIIGIELHEAVLLVLQENKKRMTTEEIANIINKRQLILKKDGSPVESHEVYREALDPEHRRLFEDVSAKEITL